MKKVVSYLYAKAYAEQTCSIKGPVVDITKRWNRNGSYFVIINVGRSYPDLRRLDVCIREMIDKKYPEILMDVNIGDNIIVTGKVLLYKGIPQVIVEQPESLVKTI